jgi:OOP family OmpA-OmpF porin
MPPGRPETVGALPENTKANQSTAQPTIPAAAQVASAADLRARACEDSLTGLVTTGQIAFEFASAELGRASFATLDKLAEAAKACPDMRIEVAGHASIEGSTEGNQHLSIRRAQSVVAYLIKAGVDSTQLQPVGYGATRPVAPNDTGENMAKNRRIEFMVRPK